MEDPMTHLSAMERFAAHNPDLDRLEDVLKEFDAFAFLGVSASEETHSNVLAWLLDPWGSHSTGDFFLTTFLRETGAATDEQTRAIDWSGTSVQREWRHVVDGATGFLDILILNPGGHFACAIENKVFSGEHTGQLTRYRRTIERHWGNFHRSHLFLTRHGILPERPQERRFWMPVDYQTVLRVVEKTLERGVNPANEGATAFLRQYATTLRRRIVPGTEVKQLATRIYLQHREAIDLIYTLKEDYIDDLSKICEKAICGQEGWKLIGPRDGKKLLGFIDTSWEDFNTFYKGTSLLPETGALLWLDFDFRVIGEVTLILTMSSGSIEDEARKLLFANTKESSPQIFDHRGSPRGEYSARTVRLYASEPILSESDIIDGDRASWPDRMTEWVSNFAAHKFEEMNEIIVTNLKEIDAELERRQAPGEERM